MHAFAEWFRRQWANSPVPIIGATIAIVGIASGWLQWRMNRIAGRGGQRGRIVMTFETKPYRPIVGNVFTVEATAKNIGQTAAVNVRGSVVTEPLIRGQQPTFGYNDVPTIRQPVVEAGREHVAVLNAARSRATGAPAPLTADILAAPQSGDVRYVVHGRFDYDDSFDSPHWVEFCVTLRAPGFDFWDPCPTHNDTDEVH